MFYDFLWLFLSFFFFILHSPFLIIPILAEYSFLFSFSLNLRHFIFCFYFPISKKKIQPPPLVTTQESSQDRDLLTQLDSELFHLNALNRRIDLLRAESPSTQSSDSILFDQTLNRTAANANRKFNLNQFLQNSVYPAECDNHSQSGLLDASFLIDHLRTMKSSDNRNSNESSSSVNSQQWDSVQFDPNDTFVDEELILNLTQKASNQTLLNETLNENEHEVLDIFEIMEEDDEPTHDETLRIDDDSVLAPLSQRQKESQHINQTIKKNDDLITSFEEEDSDDDLLNEFSMSIIDCLPGEQHE